MSLTENGTIIRRAIFGEKGSQICVERAAIYAERGSQWLILAICGEMEQPTFQKGVAIHVERVSHMQKGDNLNTTKDDSIRDSKNKIVLLNLFVT